MLPVCRLQAMTAETPVTDEQAKTPEKRIRVNLDLSQTTHRRLRVHCAERGLGVAAFVARMLDKAFEDKP